MHRKPTECSQKTFKIFTQNIEYSQSTTIIHTENSHNIHKQTHNIHRKQTEYLQKTNNMQTQHKQHMHMKPTENSQKTSRIYTENQKNAYRKSTAY